MTSAIYIPESSFYFLEGVMPAGGIWSSARRFPFIRNFLELCSFLEAVVLYDTVYAPEDEQGSVLTCSHFGEKLYAEGVLKMDLVPIVGYAVGADYSEQQRIVGTLEDKILLKHEKFSNHGKGISYFYYLHGDIQTEGAMAEANVAYKPLAMRDMLNRISTKEYNFQCELKQVYDSLALKLKNEQESRFHRGYPHKIFIPPIAALVLQKAKDSTHIPDAMIEVREEFKKLRDYFKQLESVFVDDRFSLADVIEAEKELNSITERIVNDRKSIEESRVAFLRDFGSFLIKSLLKLGLDYESLYKLLSKDVAEQVDRKYKDRGALLLLDVRKKYESIKYYGELINKVFGYSLTEGDMQVWRHYDSLHQLDLTIDLQKFNERVLLSHAYKDDAHAY